MPVNHEHKLAFIHIPKTGGVSICTALRMTELYHRQSSYYAEKYPDYTRFTVIRASNSRIGSIHRYIRNPPVGSGDENSLKLMMHDFWYWIDEPCHYYLRFEYLNIDLNQMLKQLGLPRVKLKRLNVTYEDKN